MNTLSDFNSLALYAISVALSLLGGISLLTSKEAFRGLGRVATGIGLGLLGYYLHSLSAALPFAQGYRSAHETLSLAVIGIALLTVASGARKFKRRNYDSSK